ncbi:hypothetical protein NQ317_014611, partial [Molorchus minor]
MICLMKANHILINIPSQQNYLITLVSLSISLKFNTSQIKVGKWIEKKAAIIEHVLAMKILFATSGRIDRMFAPTIRCYDAAL